MIRTRNVVGERCHLCGHDAPITPVYEDLRDVVSRERFAIVRCSGCDVLRTLPVPADLGPYYASELGRAMRQPSSRLRTALKRVMLARELRRITSRVPVSTLVDVGCGAGDFARLAHRRGLRVVAVDSGDERPLAIRDHAAIPYRRIDYESYAIEGFTGSNSLVVVARHVLEHLKDPPGFLVRMADYGARYVYIAVPNIDCLERRLLGRAWYVFDPPRHL
jgi:SAM-dependent methyltransferase